MKSELICFLAAMRFLTVLPVPWFSERDADYFSQAVKYFALIGLLIGAAGGVLAAVLNHLLPQPLLACSMLLYLSAVSGFLHLDGLADTADGFLSSRPRERILEIMRDSRSGAMGVISLVLLLLFKFGSLLCLPREHLTAAVVFLPLVGRCALVLSMAFLPYARAEGGLGKLFYLPQGWRIPALALLLVAAIGVFTGISMALLAIAALFITTLVFGFWCKRKIGGTTGDTLGAACELTETVTAFFFAVYFNI